MIGPAPSVLYPAVMDDIPVLDEVLEQGVSISEETPTGFKGILWVCQGEIMREVVIHRDRIGIDFFETREAATVVRNQVNTMRLLIGLRDQFVDLRGQVNTIRHLVDQRDQRGAE